MDKEKHQLMDFETGISIYVIDKEDSNGSSVGLHKSQDKELRSTDKENTHFDLSDISESNNSLRHFRIRKQIDYKETSSESEGDIKKQASNDNGNNFLKSGQSLSEQMHNSIENSFKKRLSIHGGYPPTSFNNTRNDNQKVKVNLSSEEISIALSETDESCDSNQEARERLNAIENIPNTGSSKSSQSMVCSVCDLKFQTYDGLQKHKMIHISISNAHDNKEIPSSKNYQRHASCQNMGDFLETFKSHLHKKSDKLLNAKEGKKTSPTHNKHEKRLFVCNICNFTSTTILKYKTHEILFHSETKKLICEFCDFHTNNCVNLATHMQLHLLSCSYCEYQCLGLADYNRHITSHLTFKCSKCDFRCNSKRKFNCHLKKNHDIKEFQCEHCKLIFRSKQVLKTHIKKHKLSHQFQCNICNKGFTNKHEFQCHKKTHKDLYECDICKSKFAQKNVLAYHLKLHTKESFKCKDCDASFPNRHNLKHHMRVHKTKDFKCVHCHFIGIDEKDILKHNCINKLYSVQRRSLDFKSNVSEVSNETIKETDTSSFLQNNTECEMSSKRNINKFQEEIISEKSSPDLKTKNNGFKSTEVIKSIDNIENKSLCLRQNLPSRVKETVVSKHNKCDVNLHNIRRKRGRPRKAENVKNIVNKTTRLTRKNGHIKMGSTMMLARRKNYHHSNRFVTSLSKHPSLLRPYDGIQIIFGKKPTTAIAGPMQFVGGSSIQCYHQSQPSFTIPIDIQQRQVNPRPLLPCRFCRYKTNSGQLLQRHIVDNHTWKPSFVNYLFS